MKSFWILWCPSSDLPPKVKFDSYHAAEKVARQMSTQYSDVFYVMRASCKVEPPESLAKVTVLV